MEILFWLLVAHFMADYPLQSQEMGRFKNKKNQPTPPKGAKPVPVWFAYLSAHSFVHAGLAALVVGFPLGLIIGVIHGMQDYLKCRIQYSPNLDQFIHISILALIYLVIA